MQRENRAEIVRRLKSVEGHVRGIVKMVDEGDVSYADVVQQTNAVFSAVRRINTLLLKDYVEERAAGDGASEETLKRPRKSHRSGDKIVNRLHPKALLAVLVLTIPLVVVLAGVASVILFRAGYGPPDMGRRAVSGLFADLGSPGRGARPGREQARRRRPGG